jgi:CubicO group peptidase (beta-lactamase class C family)
MDHNVVAGLLVLKNDRIVLEHYGLGLRESDRWSTMSTVKSMSAMLLGAAVHDGAITSIDDPVERYVPQMRGCGYEGVSIRHLLTMASGVNWNEDYADPNSDVNQYSASLARREDGGVLRILQKLRREHAPGTRWQYNTGNSFLLGCVLRNAVGRPLADYLSERIWQPAGMEFDAFYTVECEGGQEIAGSRAGMALRDIGRFAQFVIDDGVIDGRRVLPEGWVDAAFTPAYRFSGADLSWGPVPALRFIGYGYSWWIGEDGSASATGFAGQRIYIDRSEKLAIVTLSAFPQAPHVPLPQPDRERELMRLTDALREALRR